LKVTRDDIFTDYMTRGDWDIHDIII